MKQETITWDCLNQEQEVVELRDCETRLKSLLEGSDSGFGFGSTETKEEVLLLGGRRRHLLGEMEAS